MDEIDRLDRVFIKNLLVRGIIGINPEERNNRQDVRVNAVMWVDSRAAATSDRIEEAVNYRTVAKAMISHIETGEPLLVERLAAELVRICLQSDSRIRAVEVTVEKPGAVRFAESVGLTIFRTRAELFEHE